VIEVSAPSTAMSQQAEHVYSDPARIAQLEALVHQLPPNGHVSLWLRDGSSCEGIVSARPTVQQFRDADGNEGVNARVRLERAGVSDWSRYVWLDDIERIEHHDSIMGSES
jgi:hypothetical protein